MQKHGLFRCELLLRTARTFNIKSRVFVFQETLRVCAALFPVLSKFTQCIVAITKTEMVGEALDSYLVS
jgi:hypothetical protein